MTGTVFALVPPLLAIVLAITTRRVYLSLFAGVAVGAAMVTGGDIPQTLWRLVSEYAINPFHHPDRLKLLAFTTMIGATVALMAASGGTGALVSRLVRLASTATRAQVFAGLAGLLIFFDDYANCLIVGPAFMAVFAYHRLSRAKLAYIVDSTAAAVSSTMFISSWIGLELSLIKDAIAALPQPDLAGMEPYSVFLESIPFRFYLLFALALVFIIGCSGRDFGPMAASERAARKGPAPRTGRTGRRGHLALAIIPMSLLLFGTLAGLILSGRSALAAEGELASSTLRDVISAADPYNAMFWASLSSFVAALALASWPGRLRTAALARATARGAWLMIPPLLILVLAWALGDICRELGTGQYVGQALADAAKPWILPTLVFLAGAGVSFSTGTSFGTMAILMPVAIPLAAASGTAAGLAPDAAQLLLVSTVGSVLGGAVFGDHCSIISDTTILSATATRCGLVEHFQTQIPYALLAGAVAIVVGTLPAGLGISPWLCLPAGILVMIAIVRFLGRPSP